MQECFLMATFTPNAGFYSVMVLFSNFSFRLYLEHIYVQGYFSDWLDLAVEVSHLSVTFSVSFDVSIPGDCPL